ncbi:hypothetical protein LOK49_Contig30G00010 [Camellia lanceoleosa]|nr:hypothetical protein LOK49_Contig30G00010 [Camellia lanceoleosa]
MELKAMLFGRFLSLQGMNSMHRTGVDTKLQKTIKKKKKMKMTKMKKIIEGIAVMEALVSVEAEGFRMMRRS